MATEKEPQDFVYILEIYLDSGPLFLATDDIVFTDTDFLAIED